MGFPASGVIASITRPRSPRCLNGPHVDGAFRDFGQLPAPAQVLNTDPQGNSYKGAARMAGCAKGMWMVLFGGRAGR